ncbi:DUF1800 family protein [Heliobacillus mobilis]|uniref:DUF1800 family protein n=1 Tax=Heliobacterium mobile TaxID=28064 RepID=A0A6I3SEX9_HELMO|nr:DUF1800 family protein [Heliobacterium mobile]
MQAAWLRQMTGGSFPLQEKLALLWHNHFATSSVKVTRCLYRPPPS